MIKFEMRHIRIYVVHPNSTGKYKRILLSNVRNTTSLSIGEQLKSLHYQEHLTYSLTNTSQLCGITLSSFSLVVHVKAWMHCLFIDKHSCLCLAKDKWHQLVLQVAPNLCPHLLIKKTLISAQLSLQMEPPQRFNSSF